MNRLKKLYKIRVSHPQIYKRPNSVPHCNPPRWISRTGSSPRCQRPIWHTGYLSGCDSFVPSRTDDAKASARLPCLLLSGRISCTVPVSSSCGPRTFPDGPALPPRKPRPVLLCLLQFVARRLLRFNSASYPSAPDGCVRILFRQAGITMQVPLRVQQFRFQF